MKFIGIVFVGCSLLWLLISSTQASRSVGLRLLVPEWLARICGSKTAYVDPGLMSLQLLCFLAFIWSIPSGLLSGDNPPGLLFRQGLLFIISIIFLIFLFLVYISKKQYK